MTSSSSYHIPVLLHAAVEGLNIHPHGIFVDATFGGGGHSREILSRLTDGKLVAFDQDPDAAANAAAIKNPNLVFVAENFRYLQHALQQNGFDSVDGILADLGVSTHQFDTAERGFSFRFNADLDMRMDQSGELTAARVVNTYEPSALSRVLYLFGELRNANQLAAHLSRERKKGEILTTQQLVDCLRPLTPRKEEKQFLARVFQALRMEVNGELDALQEFLTQAIGMLKPDGRLVIIAYHSLEDRLVKNFIRSGNAAGELKKDFYGNTIRPLVEVNRKPIGPDTDEIEKNPRSRSARLRIARKVNNE